MRPDESSFVSSSSSEWSSLLSSERGATDGCAVAEAGVQQCYRVSPGPDFVLVLWVPDMAGYQALVQRLFTEDANVRNVKAYFSIKRGKFDTAIAV